MEPGLLLSFAAGMLSFTSPCCLPLLPGYLGFVSGLTTEEAETTSRKRTLLGAVLFVIGFAIVFTSLGASASVLGNFLLRNRIWLWKVSGVFLLVMGTLIVLRGGLPFLNREVRTDMGKMQRGPVGALPLGMAFAFGWTPCVGPVLAGLLTYAGASGSLAKGAGLLFVYSLGLGVPLHRIGLFLREGEPFFPMAEEARSHGIPSRRCRSGGHGCPTDHRGMDVALRADPAVVLPFGMAPDLTAHILMLH